MKRKVCLPHILLLLLCVITLNSCVSEPSRASRPIIEDLGDSAQTDEEETIQEISRPDGQVFLQSGFCACKAGKPAILGQCGTYCASKSSTDQNTILYLDTKLGEEVSLNDMFGDLAGWCTAQIPQSDPDAVACANPSCVLRLNDSNGNQIDLNLDGLVPGSTKVQITLDEAQVAVDTTYIAKIVESQCGDAADGEGASSDSIQFRRIDGFDSVLDLDPLKIDPAIAYTCINRLGRAEADSGTQFYDLGFKLHFYYVDHNKPPIVPVNPDIFCHDIAQYGPVQQTGMNRLEMIPGVFNIWSTKDPRLYDLNPDPVTGSPNTRKDVEDTMDTLIKQDGISAGLTFEVFYPLNWANYPGVSSGDGDGGDASASQTLLGFIMAPFVDPDTDRSFCPEFDDYTDPEITPAIRAMKDVVGIDTEGIYLGVREAESIDLDGLGQYVQSPDDYIIIREGLLKQIWFYFENEQAIAPTSINEGSKTLNFYWPPNIISPYVKNSDQKLYTVRHPSEAGDANGTAGNTATTVLMPHDKKFACVPKATYTGQ